MQNKTVKIISIAVLFFTQIAKVFAINWVYNYIEALKSAESTGKPVMIDFYTEWCGWCKSLDKDTYSDSRVNERANNFICVKIDGDKEPGLIKQYGIGGFPTIIFLDSTGKIIETIVGYRDAENFLKVMQKIAGNTKEKKTPKISEEEKVIEKTKPRERNPEYEDYLVYKGYIKGSEGNIKAQLKYKGENYIVEAGDNFEGNKVTNIAPEKMILKNKKGKLLVIKFNRPVRIR